MIKIKLDKDNIIISGHSGYDVQGKDIVCAGVSVLSITTVNAMLRFDKESVSYEKKDGYLNIKILHHTPEIDILLENMISLLREMEKDYKKNIEIK